MSDKEFKKPTGTQDIFGKKQRYFRRVREVAREVADIYNFQEIETPIIEEEALFARGVGDETDIVQKEMFVFETKGEDRIALRPEGTAPIVRSYIEHDLYKKPQPVKFFYFGPFFRYERPQRGRFRQFHQFGFELLGKKSSALDGQMVLVFYRIFQKLGLDVVVKINNLGDQKCRPEYVKKLKSYLKNQDDICEDCARRIEKNPLRVLDCKSESCRKVIRKAPEMIDHLCKSCKADFKEVLEFLDEFDIPYELDSHLVRGLDYYTNTVFEFFAVDGDLALGGGGRYDGLVEELGGRETPACGGAVGVERVVELMRDKGIKVEEEKKKIFLAQLGTSAKKKAFELFEEFRQEGVPVYESMGRDSLKSQMSRADKLGAEYTLILGRQECIKNEIIIREMKTGKQETVPLPDIIKEMKKRL